jgi:hypothetical protein
VFDASNAYVQSGDELVVQVKKNTGGYTSGGMATCQSTAPAAADGLHPDKFWLLMLQHCWKPHVHLQQMYVLLVMVAVHLRAEVFLDYFLSFGDYIFVVKTNPASVREQQHRWYSRQN